MSTSEAHPVGTLVRPQDLGLRTTASWPRRWVPDAMRDEWDDGRRPALVLIDLQRDYFADGELARCRDDLVFVCNRLVRAAQEAGVPVVEVRTVHEPDRSTWTLSMREDGEGLALRGSAGAEPVDGLAPVGGDVVLKTRDSAFFGTDLDKRLASVGVNQVVLCGVSTESCISATATDAFAHDLAVVLVSDATASIEWSLHDDTLDRLQRQYRQEVVASDVLFERWQPGG